MANTTQIRITQETKIEIDSLLPEITSKIYESNDKDLIKQISKRGLSYSNFVKVLIKWYKEKEGKPM